MPQTKADLITAIAVNRRLPIGRADAIVNQIFSAMAETLVRGDSIEIRGFGSFTVRHYGAYEGRNPRTGAPAHVKPKRLPFFKVGKELRERIETGRLAGVMSSGSSRGPPDDGRRSGSTAGSAVAGPHHVIASTANAETARPGGECKKCQLDGPPPEQATPSANDAPAGAVASAVAGQPKAVPC